MFIVYKHTNKINGKVYIGITCQKLNDRWRKGKGYNKGTYIYNAIQKYGWNNFEHEVLLDGLTEKEARKKETELISFYKSNDERFGYNLTEGGEHNIPNKVVRDKISKANKANMTPERRQQHREIALKLNYTGDRNPFYGKHHDESTRKRMSENHWSKKYPEKFKQVTAQNLNSSENSIFAKAVIRLIDGKYYDSMSECAEDNNLNLDTITQHCMKRYKNIEYMYYEDYRLLSEDEQYALKMLSFDRRINPMIHNPQNKAVIDIINGQTYISVKACHEQTHCDTTTIINSCKGRCKFIRFMYVSDYENCSKEAIQDKINAYNDYKNCPAKSMDSAKPVIRLVDGFVICGVSECGRLHIATDHTIRRHCNNELKDMSKQEYMWLEDYEKLTEYEKGLHKKRVENLYKNKAKKDKIVRKSDGKVYETTTICAKDNNCCSRKVLDHCKGLVEKQEYVYLSDYKYN